MTYSTTPYPVDPFSRLMIESFNEKNMISIPTAFQSLWRSGQVRYNDSGDVVEIDIVRGNEKIAALVRRSSVSGRNISHKKSVGGRWTNFVREFPLAYEESPIQGDSLNLRRPGEAPYGGASRLQRLRDQARDLTTEQIRRIIRLNEYLASQAAITGKQPYLIGDTDDIIDFKRDANNTHAVTTAWDAANATPIADLEAGCKQVRAAGMTTPNVLILASDSSSALFSDSSLQALANIRGFTFILAGTAQTVPANLAYLVEGGFQYIGRMKLPGGWDLEVFVSNDVWDDDGTSTPYMPSGYGVILSTNARFDRYIGPPVRLELPGMQQLLQQDVFGVDMSLGLTPPNVKGNWAMPPGSFFVDCHPSPDWDSVMIRTQQATIFAPVATDSIYTLTGLVTP